MAPQVAGSGSGEAPSTPSSAGLDAMPKDSAVAEQATGDSASAGQNAGAADAKPALSVKSNGDGTFVLSGSGFVGTTAYIRVVGTRAKDYAYGQAWGSAPIANGSFSATTPDVCGVEGGDRFFSANDARPDKSDATGTLWSNTVKTSCPSAGGGGDDPPDDPPSDPGSGDAPAGEAGSTP